MPVTIEGIPITGQQSFDGYVADFLGFALRLVNELATGLAYGHAQDPPTDPAVQLAVIDDALADHEAIHTAPMGPDDAAELTAAVHRLRTAVDACMDGEPLDAAQVLNDLLTESRAVPNLHARPGRPLVLAFHSVGDSPVTSHIGDMAASLALIIGTGRAGRLGRCTAERCDRVFYDTTRNGSRRFCGVGCQNRVKATAYRARRPPSQR
jgi:predicted RNA-binding Zn ribbon-like protein